MNISQTTPRPTTALLAASASAALLLAACGEGGSDPAAAPDEGELLTTRHAVTVLDDGDGPELCLGGVMESYPPQCGGPELLGFEWPEGSYEEESGVRWGTYVVRGHYDSAAQTFEVAEIGDEEDAPAHAGDEHDLGTLCEEPDGGWQVVDPERTTDEDMQAVYEAAQELPGYAGAWMDQSRNPVGPEDVNEAAEDLESGEISEEELAELEGAMNDPEYVTVNIRVTEDPEAAYDELREIWGGALCVAEAERTEAELREIQEELPDNIDGMLASYTETRSDQVVVDVVYDDGTVQQQLDGEYGEGVVRVVPALIPAEELSGE